ncbi:hypothetical protein J3459_016674 [Metarhizium acridum]|nr:hypothetical protein J3459_016674 [Metarhizium acridum]
MAAYLYKDVTIPDSFLAGPSAELVTMEFVDFAASSIPEHEGKTAVVMDNVLSEAECQQYMALAEEAALWAPALVNVGKGLESYIPKHRLSLRIVWDHQGMVALIFSRCLQVPELQKLLSRPPKLDATSKHGAVNPEHWELVGLNNRMRVLKYIKGEYFEGTSRWVILVQRRGRDALRFFLLYPCVHERLDHGISTTRGRLCGRRDRLLFRRREEVL